MAIKAALRADLAFSLGPGDVLYMLGANGTGKSGLVSRLFSAHQAKAKRISAHRQTWFRSNTLDMTPRNRDDLERNIRSQDAQETARYLLEYADQRVGVAIFDLIDADTMLNRKIADLVRAGDTVGAKKKAKTPAPMQVISELMQLSNIPIEISVEERERVIAKKDGGPGYSVAELSDGERNARAGFFQCRADDIAETGVERAGDAQRLALVQGLGGGEVAVKLLGQMREGAQAHALLAVGAMPAHSRNQRLVRLGVVLPAVAVAALTTSAFSQAEFVALEELPNGHGSVISVAD